MLTELICIELILIDWGEFVDKNFHGFILNQRKLISQCKIQCDKSKTCIIYHGAILASCIYKLIYRF